MRSTGKKRRQVVVGVDGGGTKTTCAVIEYTSVRPITSPSQITVLASATTGSSNANSVGAAKAKEALLGSITAALAQLGARNTVRGDNDVGGDKNKHDDDDDDDDEYQVCAVSLCMSGVDRASDKDTVRAWLSECTALHVHKSDTLLPPEPEPEPEPHKGHTLLPPPPHKGDTFPPPHKGDAFPPHIFINNDAVGALCSGTLGAVAPGRSAVLISGTGMICVGVDARGAWVRAGGWGPLLGDQGSGYEIGHAALQCVCNMHDAVVPVSGLLDGIAHSALTAAVLRSAGVAHVADLIGYVYGRGSGGGEWSAIAAFASVCLECAREGDLLAQRIVSVHAESLFRYVDALVHRMRNATMEVAVAAATPVPVATPVAGQEEQLQQQEEQQQEPPPQEEEEQQQQPPQQQEQEQQHNDFTLVLSGSILAHDQSIVAEKLSKLVWSKYKNANILLPRVSAAVGSALFALQSPLLKGPEL